MIKYDNQPLNPEIDIEDFTVDRYRELIQIAKKSYTFSSYAEIPFGARFVLWRHDCDLSLNRALKLAEIEQQEDITTTYLINPHCDFYNPFEKGQSAIIQKILDLKHHIGLHFDAEYHSTESESELDEQVGDESIMLQRFFGVRPVAVSFHNPTEFLLACEEETYGGLVNCYSKRIKEAVPYVSDSNGYWRYRRLRDVLEKGEDHCLHVLTHPVWWQDCPMLPMDRVNRSIQGRAEALRMKYINTLRVTGRKNIGHD